MNKPERKAIELKIIAAVENVIPSNGMKNEKVVKLIRESAKQIAKKIAKQDEKVTDIVLPPVKIARRAVKNSATVKKTTIVKKKAKK
jgi:hypothetical protein